jgi:hypothetical protein
MIGTQDSLFPQSEHAVRRAAGGAINGTRVLLGILLVLIGIAAIVGVVVTARNGQTDAAIVIGIVAAAFFTRVGC